MSMTATKDPAARRFREIRLAVQALARGRVGKWPETFKEQYLRTIETLVENYLASIPSLSRIIKPSTFTAGACVITCRYLRGLNITFEARADMEMAEMNTQSENAAATIVHTICPSDHAWIGRHCSKCLTMQGDSQN